MDVPRRKKSSSTSSLRNRLGKFSSDLLEEECLMSDKSEDKNWQYAIVSCGSNAFTQISNDTMELMSTSLQHSRFPISDSASAATSSHIALISASSNLSAAVVQCVDGAQECYVWGSGLPTTNMRVPLSMPPKFEQKIKQLSCGQSHAGFVTFDGKVYTWGANDSGMLGHGGKASLNAPKRIDSMNKMEVVAISCGAYHTAIIASEEDRPCDYITVPDYYAMDSLEGRSNRYSIKRPEESFLPSGSLYCFGMGKAGQLGLDSIAKKGTSSSARNVGKPTKVSHFEKAKEKVIKVSCGFHHTLVITVPADDVSSNTGFYQPTVYSFGWGEHGRLGNGTEIESVVPVKVEFPEPFTALDVCAGEQHSLAAGREDCYAWGNNSMGQLGVSNPASTPQALSPLKIILPEGMKVRYLGAGGRHSAAITYCNRLLTWGWGEDGQLGHGTEKSSYLPRPCKIPRIASKAGNPVSLSLGMSHTLVLLKNKEYVPQLPEVVEKETVKEEAELKVVEEAVPIEATVVPLDPIPEPEPEPKLELWTNEEADIEFEHELLQEVSPPPPVLNHKPAYLVDEYELMEPNETKPEPPQVVRGIKELLHQREERIQRQEEMDRAAATEEVIETLEESPRVVDYEKEEENIPEDGGIEVQKSSSEESMAASVPEEAINTETYTTDGDDIKRNSTDNAVNVFYKKGQNLDSCLVANYARREEIRKQKKLAAEKNRKQK